MTSVLSVAQHALARADALLITAGAGMGVDSGLPDFRGNEGFWKAYPPFRTLGLSFVDLANPAWFKRDPSLAWGFYGHRLQLYRTTSPHRGFHQLLTKGQNLPLGSFVFTSNVDGQFQKAGFREDQLFEVHGSIHHLQCTRANCHSGIWPATCRIEIDPSTMRALGPLPRCPTCQSLARPNILMFGDAAWDESRSMAQQGLLQHWLSKLGREHAKLVIIEMGAGLAVPTVRHFSERTAKHLQATFIRINPREAFGPPGTLSFETSTTKTLDALLGG